MRSVVDFGHQPSPDCTPFHDLDQGLQRLRNEDPHTLPAAAMGDDLKELRRHINGCEAEFTRRLRRFDRGNESSSRATATRPAAAAGEKLHFQRNQACALSAVVEE